MRRQKRRLFPGTNTGSMADIGFLLIILVLSMTSIYEEKTGIAMKLMPWNNDITCYPPDKMPTTFRVDINSLEQIMVSDKVVEVSDIKLMCKEFILRNELEGNNGIIQFRTNRNTSFKIYITVLNEMRSAFNEVWRNESKRRFNKDYKGLSINEKRIIRRKYPFALLEKKADYYLYTY